MARYRTGTTIKFISLNSYVLSWETNISIEFLSKYLYLQVRIISPEDFKIYFCSLKGSVLLNKFRPEHNNKTSKVFIFYLLCTHETIKNVARGTYLWTLWFFTKKTVSENIQEPSMMHNFGDMAVQSLLKRKITIAELSVIIFYGKICRKENSHVVLIVGYWFQQFFKFRVSFLEGCRF